MFIGSGMVYLSIEWADSLKDKRRVVKSLIDRMKNKFNISVAEVSENDMIKQAVIGFCCVSNSKVHAEQMLNAVIDFVHNGTDAEVYNYEIEII